VHERVVIRTTIGREEVTAGALFINRDNGTFRYDESYLARPGAFALAPALPLVAGPLSHAGTGPFSDSAPDRWGRKILERAAKRTKLREHEYLLGVADHGRQGATRFFDSDGDEPLAPRRDGVPTELDLPDLITTADQVNEGRRDIAEQQLRRLYDASGSLGGARPKASVTSQQGLWLAKFPKNDDDWDVPGWEGATLALQRELGIDVPQHKMLRIADKTGRVRNVLLLSRFDRNGETRIPYISAMTALEAADGDGGDWLDLAEFAQINGADAAELWRRSALGSLIGNADDHLRNHGFLRSGAHWSLSPAFDVNPTPLEEEQSFQLSMFGESNRRPDGMLERDVLALFGVAEPEARSWFKRAEEVLASAMSVASKHVQDEVSQDVMRDRFEDAMTQARALAPDPTSLTRRSDTAQPRVPSGPNGGQFGRRSAPPPADRL
jgi:serine/threonine-protein kinase HipA